MENQGIAVDTTARVRQCLLLALLAATSGGQTIRYVDQNVVGGNQTGTSWTDAYPTLAQAIAGVQSLPGAVQLWVANGTYTPTQGVVPGGRSTTFNLRPDISFYGHFQGGETALSQRPDPRISDPTRDTVLSGDLNGNDGASLCAHTGRADNSFHVMTANATLVGSIPSSVVVDGFRFRGGNADGAVSFDLRGSALYVRSGGAAQVASPSFHRCTFESNSSDEFGAVAIEGGSSAFTECRFVCNRALASNGGAFGVLPGPAGALSAPSLVGCEFDQNEAPRYGGALFTHRLTTVTSCVFTANRATSAGGNIGRGGAAAFFGSGSTVTGTQFVGNQAISGGEGGAVYAEDGASNTFTNCRFEANAATAGGGGGAIRFLGLVQQPAPITVVRCRFVANSGFGGGGALQLSNAQFTAHSCLFVANSAAGGNGGAINLNGGPNYLNKCTFADNAAPAGFGGAVIATPNALAVGLDTRNCVFWGNTHTGSTSPTTSSHIYDNGVNSFLSTLNSCFEWPTGAALPAYGSATNIVSDPRFRDPANGDYRLCPLSPCIDAGTNASLPPGMTDLDGQPVPDVLSNSIGQTAVPDMGCDEELRPFDGTDASKRKLVLETTVQAFLPASPSACAVDGVADAPNSVVTLYMHAPAGDYVFSGTGCVCFPFIIAQMFVNGAPAPGPVFPDLHMSLAHPISILLDPASPIFQFSPPLMPAQGVALSFWTGPGFGLSALIQGGVSCAPPCAASPQSPNFPGAFTDAIQINF